MNWDAIGAVAELLGAIGVILSLVYVAIQVKASTRASMVESKLRVSDKKLDFHDMLIANPELNDLMIRGRKGTENLAKDEWLQFANLCMKAGWHLSASFFLHRQGAIGDDDFHEVEIVGKYWTSSRGFQQWWNRMGKDSFSGPFKVYVERLIAEAL